MRSRQQMVYRAYYGRAEGPVNRSYCWLVGNEEMRYPISTYIWFRVPCRYPPPSNLVLFCVSLFENSRSRDETVVVFRSQRAGGLGGAQPPPFTSCKVGGRGEERRDSPPHGIPPPWYPPPHPP